MAISFSKRELEKKKQGKKLEKQQRKEERKANRGGSSLDDMIAYVDANGMITDTPPDMSSKPKVDAETIAVFVPKKEEQEPVALRGRVEHFNTDSFHATVFSMLFGKPFYVYISEPSKVFRISNLLDILGIKRRIVNDVDDAIAAPSINYETVNQRLSAYRESSLNYLKSILA